MPIITQRIPTSSDNPHLLGRKIEHDTRSQMYGVAPKATSTLKTVVHTRYVPILDQEDLQAQGIQLAGDPDALNSCTGNAGIGIVGSLPLYIKQPLQLRRQLRDAKQAEIAAIDLYAEATEQDEFPETWPPTDDGSSGLGVAKALVNKGVISSYKHCFDLQSLLTALQTYPVLFGINWYECVVPGTRVLTQDLEWLPVEKLSPGDALLGFDENIDRNCSYRPSQVVSNDVIVRPCVELITDRGTITVSTNHLFVQRHAKAARHWVRADQLQPGDEIMYFGDPWEVDQSWEAGWLAGFYDGEGSLAGSTSEHRAGNLLTAAQLPGPTLNRALNYLSARGFDHGMRVNQQTGVHCWYLRGEAAKCRFLGSIRPGRLLAVADRAWNGHRIFNKSTKPAVVQSVTPAGRQEVHAIGTSTGTLLTEGYLSHNSMFDPRHDGTVEISGAVAGGHEVIIDAVFMEAQKLRLPNSWTSQWSEGGCFFLDFEQTDRLLSEQGDAIVLLP